jgi:hypothetical protein
VPLGAELRLRLYFPGGTSHDVVAQAVERRPAIVDGKVRHRLHLKIAPESAER